MKYFSVLMVFIPFLIISCSDPQAGELQLIKVDPVLEILFSTTYIGEYEDQEVVISNVGTGDIDVKKLEILYSLKAGSIEPQAKEFTIVDAPSLPFSLKERESKTITVRYKPSAVVKYDEIALNIYNSTASNPKASIGIKVIELRPRISVNPNTIIFTGIAAGSEVSEIVTITNVGTADLIIKKGEIKLAAAPSVTLISFEGSNIESNTNAEDITICPSDLPDGNSCKKSFRFKLKYVAPLEDQSNGGIRINSNSLDNKGQKNNIYIPIITSSSQCVLNIFPQESVIDMGNRRVNVVSSKTFVLKNSGQSVCNISNISLFEDENNAFELKDLPSFPAILNSGERLNFDIEFSPTQEISYSAKLEIIADDPTWTDGKKELSLIATGRIATGPVAICKIAETGEDTAYVEPAIDNERLHYHSVITLDGRASYDTTNPNGLLTFQWTKVSAPEGNTSQPETPTQGQSKYFVDVTGVHKLKLTVTNEEGETDSCEVRAEGLSSNSLHIELFWDVGSDVDLHLRAPDGNDNDWSTTKDCYFGNCTTSGSSGASGLEWGGPGTDDNPKLDRDDVGGTGPENINLKAPSDSNNQSYTVAAHYYDAKNASNGTNATIKVYCNGDMQYSGTQKLEATNWFWYAANIKWFGEGEEGTCEVNPINIVQDHKPN